MTGVACFITAATLATCKRLMFDRESGVLDGAEPADRAARTANDFLRRMTLCDCLHLFVFIIGGLICLLHLIVNRVYFDK